MRATARTRLPAQLRRIGRGRTKEDVAKTFGVGLSTLTVWVKDGAWSSKLGEERRRWLSRRVLLAGLYRLRQGEEVDVRKLMASAEWRAAEGAERQCAATGLSRFPSTRLARARGPEQHEQWQ